jgi:hypothetical protein
MNSNMIDIILLQKIRTYFGLKSNSKNPVPSSRMGIYTYDRTIEVFYALNKKTEFHAGLFNYSTAIFGLLNGRYV